MLIADKQAGEPQVPRGAELKDGVMTLVLIEEDEHWLVTAAHNTDVVPVSMPA